MAEWLALVGVVIAQFVLVTLFMIRLRIDERVRREAAIEAERVRLEAAIEASGLDSRQRRMDAYAQFVAEASMLLRVLQVRSGGYPKPDDTTRLGEAYSVVLILGPEPVRRSASFVMRAVSDGMRQESSRRQQVETYQGDLAFRIRTELTEFVELVTKELGLPPASRAIELL